MQCNAIFSIVRIWSYSACVRRRLWLKAFFASLPRNASRLCLCAMNFSDDEDFFARAGEDDDELLPFEGYECNQPPEEMLPPEDEVILEPEQTQKGSAARGSSQPGQGSQISEVEFDCNERKSRRSPLPFFISLEVVPGTQHYSRPIPHPTPPHPTSSILPTPSHPIHFTPPIPTHLTPLHPLHPIRILSHPTPTTSVDGFLGLLFM